LKVWDIDAGLVVRTIEGHSDVVHSVAVSADGNRAVSASDDNTLKVWNPDTGLLIATFYCEATTRCCAWVDQQRVVAGDNGGRVYFLVLEQPSTLAHSSGLSKRLPAGAIPF
jgi:WD40 repeat protein